MTGDVTSVNRRAMWTLFRKEIQRFTKVWLQTVISPLVTTSLYFLVFGVALGARVGTMSFTGADGVAHEVPYGAFVVPGLMMLSMISNSFLNTSSSLFQSKINGTLVDLLTAPLGTPEILTAYLSAAVFRGVAVGFLVWVVAGLFTGFALAHPLWAIFFSVAVTTTFAGVGLLAALWAEKFDHLSIFPNFIVQPLTFLGGVFYSVTDLPPLWETISRCNPVLYTVSGLRYGILGVSEIPVMTSALAVGSAMVVVLGMCAFALTRGYGMRR
jgi:ABC-2 type transport system permease protein